MLKWLVDALNVTFEGADDAGLGRRFREVDPLPEKDQHVIKTLLDASLTRKQPRTLVR
jgi:hypothetical protein